MKLQAQPYAKIIIGKESVEIYPDRNGYELIFYNRNKVVLTMKEEELVEAWVMITDFVYRRIPEPNL